MKIWEEEQKEHDDEFFFPHLVTTLTITTARKMHNDFSRQKGGNV